MGRFILLVVGLLGMLATTTGASDPAAQGLEIDSNCVGRIRSAIARGALECRSIRDPNTGEMILLPAKFGKEFHPGKFKGPDRTQEFLEYIGLDQAYLDARGCVLGPVFVNTFRDCVDFDAESQCPPPDLAEDGWPDSFETGFGSDPASALSTPELAAIDDQHGTNVCDDGLDNDGDGHVDKPDKGCRDTCEDFGLTDGCDDTDRDGWLNYVEDIYGSDQTALESTPEAILVGTCDDGLDNDGDGLADGADTSCPPFGP
jgi:hypothetical protein